MNVSPELCRLLNLYVYDVFKVFIVKLYLLF